MYGIPKFFFSLHKIFNFDVLSVTCTEYAVHQKVNG